MRRAGAWTGWVLVLAVLLGGCGRDADEPGVAATVNGVPITVAALEARHDLSRLGLPEAENPAVERLRAEYGAVLADMIVDSLAGQELSRRHLGVTDAELAKAEAVVRADYPGDAFGRMLLEEHIALERWREALRDRLTVEKFAREVLGPHARVGVSEAADYYKDHIDAFTTPARTRFLLVQGKDAGSLKAALAAFRSSGARSDLTGIGGVSVEEMTLPEGNLPQAWREALRSVKPGEASSILSDETGNAALILLERRGETVLEPAKAYARVEAILSADKLEQAFAAWLTKALAGARIRVHTALVADSQTPQPPHEATTPPVQAAEKSAKAVSAEGQAASPASGQAFVPPPPPQAAADKSDASTLTPPALANAAAPSAALPAAPAVASASAASGEDKAAAVVQPTAQPAPAVPVPAEAVAPSAGVHEVEYSAVKASWILYTADGKPEERVYLKPGNPLRITFTQRLSVRLGSPSEVRYRYRGKEKTVEVKKKESRILEFP